MHQIPLGAPGDCPEGRVSGTLAGILIRLADGGGRLAPRLHAPPRESQRRTVGCAAEMDKRGCQPAIQTREVQAATSAPTSASERRLTRVRNREASKLAWTGLIR